MTDVQRFYQIVPPWVVVEKTKDEDRKLIAEKRYGFPSRKPVVRVLRGKKMMTIRGLMDECGAALQFFEGFGENWPALEECLCYMDEWLPGDAYILEVIDGQYLLKDESPDQLVTFLELLCRVGEWWSRPINDNPPHNRPATPFHVVIKLDGREASLFVEKVRNLGPEAACLIQVYE